jgi:transglutaminase-like putative cysteine protease
MRLEIRYLNQFTYGNPAWESHNLLRACPAEDEHQRLLAYRVEVAPAARVNSYIDFWGTRVDEFGVRDPHWNLRISAESDVETSPRPWPRDDFPLQSMASLGEELSTYLRRSPHASWNDAIEEAAVEATRNADTVVAAITSVHDTVASTLDYAPGTTYVGVDVADVLAQGKGVCQDYSHLAIAMCRSVGIPARYVSGYLYAADQTVAVAPEEPELSVQTHAWIETYVPGHGWWALDPTNASTVGELHVKIGHGRDYEDVMPLRGVYHGGAEHDLGVHVQISRERLSEQVIDQ